jgi:multicomponent Na+:H+ antiporter subunit F
MMAAGPWTNDVLTAAMWVAIAILGAAVLIGLYRVATATDLGTRAIVGDLVFFAALGVLVLLGTMRDSAVVVDAALLASLLGILATIALARIITRGRR